MQCSQGPVQQVHSEVSCHQHKNQKKKVNLKVQRQNDNNYAELQNVKLFTQINSFQMNLPQEKAHIS